jgi:hypothetical protein
MRDAVIRTVIVLLCAAGLLGLGVIAPAGLRRMDVFHVERVELVGARHLDGAAAVEASGLTTESNLFEDPDAWRASLLQHPLVAHVEIGRRVPGTIVLHVRETVPIAFARTPELRAVDATGRLLPIDHAADDMDLPVLDCATRIDADGRATDPETLRAVRFLEITRQLAPSLLGWISEVGAHGDAVRLVLRNAADAEVLVPAEPSAERLAELQHALADLATPRLAAAGTDTTDGGVELARVKRIDGRFHDQIVVALHRGKN